MGFNLMIAGFVGGLGLFMLGMGQMTDGLKGLAGGALKTILASFTSNRPKALLVGAGLTALVQSSSAITVAAIGFINAGLLTLPQAIATLVTQVGIAPERALAMATSEPARLIGLQASHGALLPGRKTEMVRLGPDFHLIEHWL